MVNAVGSPAVGLVDGNGTSAWASDGPGAGLVSEPGLRRLLESINHELIQLRIAFCAETGLDYVPPLDTP